MYNLIAILKIALYVKYHFYYTQFADNHPRSEAVCVNGRIKQKAPILLIIFKNFGYLLKLENNVNLRGGLKS